jgi:hypothetical protein
VSELEKSSSAGDMKSAPIPDAVQIFNIFNQFLIRWANQESKYVSMRMEDLSPLTLEQGIFFFEPFEGVLVVRTKETFEKVFSELSGGKKSLKDPHEKGLFLELVVLFWHLFVSQIWRLDTRTIKPALLKASIPQDWPDRKPDSACTVFIKDVPLEILLWVRVTPEETKTWKKPSPPR